ncbi:MAG: hypothetical protein JWO52_1222 [Gammaproteobacteria bacterium]|jgi:hypothetical protein|nr:hypothetical protein [Gammaproteobacteria bacterium]
MKFPGAAIVSTFLLASGATAAVPSAYPSMAPLVQYLMPRDAEIALARSAAPDSISGHAEVLILTDSGFQIAVKGTNGFVCMVARSWSADFDDPDFWNPRLRAPICYNELAARSQVAATIKRTQLALAGESRKGVLKSIKEASESGELPHAISGSMCYMMSRKGYLSSRNGHWLPHLMFFTPETDPAAWGAGLPDSPILGIERPEEHLTVFLIPIGHWSDGTPAAQGSRHVSDRSAIGSN